MPIMVKLDKAAYEALLLELDETHSRVRLWEDRYHLLALTHAQSRLPVETQVEVPEPPEVPEEKTKNTPVAMPPWHSRWSSGTRLEVEARGEKDAPYLEVQVGVPHLVSDTAYLIPKDAKELIDVLTGWLENVAKDVVTG